MGLTDYNNTVMPRANMLSNTKPAEGPKFEHGAKQAKGSGFDMTTEDFMTLIMAQFQNQDIMNPASTDDFLNQMIQMMTIQTMTNMNDISTISYAASLVGKEVTIGIPTQEGLQEIVGVVTGTGSMDGQQVIIVNDEEYALNQILAVGRLPEKKDPEEESTPDVDGEGAESVEAPEKPEGSEETPDGTEGVDGETTAPETSETAPEATETAPEATETAPETTETAPEGSTQTDTESSEPI